MLTRPNSQHNNNPTVLTKCPVCSRGTFFVLWICITAFMSTVDVAVCTIVHIRCAGIRHFLPISSLLSCHSWLNRTPNRRVYIAFRTILSNISHTVSLVSQIHKALLQTSTAPYTQLWWQHAEAIVFFFFRTIWIDFTVSYFHVTNV